MKFLPYITCLNNNQYIDDDKLQEIYFQISQINPSLPVHQVVGEATSLVDTIKEGASKLNDQGKFISHFAFTDYMLTIKNLSNRLPQLPVKTNFLSILPLLSPHCAHLLKHP